MSQTAITTNFALEARGVSVALGGVTVLAVPSLQVAPNEVLVVIGPNGSGKTTLLLTLAGLLKPAAGTLTYQGKTADTKAEMLRLHRRMAVVFQEALLLNSTVWDNVTLGLRLRGVNKEEIKPRAEKWLERFGINHLAKRQARMLSGGEAKRVSLARAFVLEPEVLFLDEPFAALDSPTRQALLEDFESVLRETKVTTVMVTHDSNEALALAHRVLVLMDGKIRQIGSREEVFSSPVDEQVAAFVGVENIIDGVVTSNQGGIATVSTDHSMLEVFTDSAVGDKVSVCIRPEAITLATSRASSSARNSFAGVITRTAPFGALSRVEIDCGFRLVVLVTNRSAEEMGLEKGKQVFASFKATGVHVIRR